MTEPNAWLSRDPRASGADKLIALACPVLREAINKATVIFDDCQRASTGAPDEDLPVFMSLIHMIEMADAIEVLLSSSSVHPAKLLLRSMFEADLSIQYILEADSKRRSFAWLVTRAHRQLAAYEAMSQKTAAGRELRSLLADDDFQLNLDAIPEGDLDDAIDNLRELLKQENYRGAEAEYRRVRKKRGKPEWYSLNGGPSNVRELARHLKQLSAYQFLYRTWSELVHAGDAGRWLTKSPSGSPAFYTLRNGRDMLQVANFAITFLVGAMLALARKFGKTAGLGEWYVEEVRSRFLALTGTKLNIFEEEAGAP